MSKELYLSPFKRDAAPQPKPGSMPAPPKLLPATPPADLRLLPSHDLAVSDLFLNSLKGRVLSALSANFENFHSSGLSKAVGTQMRGVVKGDALYLPMPCVDSHVSYGVGVRRIVRSLEPPHGKISAKPAQFRSIRDPDAHLWVCLTRQSLGMALTQGVESLASASGHPASVVSAELVLKNKANGKETGEEITLFIALAR